MKLDLFIQYRVLPPSRKYVKNEATAYDEEYRFSVEMGHLLCISGFNHFKRISDMGVRLHRPDTKKIGRA